jgi:hypothetical protein
MERMTDNRLATWMARARDAEESRAAAQREAIFAQLDAMEIRQEVERLRLRLTEMQMRKKTGKAT